MRKVLWIFLLIVLQANALSITSTPVSDVNKSEVYSYTIEIENTMLSNYTMSTTLPSWLSLQEYSFGRSLNENAINTPTNLKIYTNRDAEIYYLLENAIYKIGATNTIYSSPNNLKGFAFGYTNIPYLLEQNGNEYSITQPDRKTPLHTLNTPNMSIEEIVVVGMDIYFTEKMDDPMAGLNYTIKKRASDGTITTLLNANPNEEITHLRTDKTNLYYIKNNTLYKYEVAMQATTVVKSSLQGVRDFVAINSGINGYFYITTTNNELLRMDKDGNIQTILDASNRYFTTAYGLGVDSMTQDLYIEDRSSSGGFKQMSKLSNPIISGTALSSGSYDVNITLSQDYAANIVQEFSITVHNQAPIGSNFYITMDEDSNKAFSVSDFKFKDSDSADSLQSIVVIAPPVKGSLKLSGVDVNPNQVILRDSISNLVYRPLENESGGKYASFTFKVSDGEANSTDSYRATFDVIDVEDTTPNSFSFTSQTNQEINTSLSSKKITISGMDDDTNISIVGGEYQINSGTWSATPSTIDSDDNVTVRLTSSTSYETKKGLTLTVGTMSSDFNVTTRSKDTTPNGFSFSALTNQALSTQVVSNSVRLSGMDDNVTISISGGEYQINNDNNWTTVSSTVDNNDTIQVRTTSSSNYSDKVTASLSVGTLSANFDVTTKEQPTPSNTKPTITNLSDAMTMDDNQSINPFSTVELDDRNNDNLSITLSLDTNTTGSLSSYEIASGDIASVQKALRAIIFTPFENIAPLGEQNTTTITLKLSDGKDTVARSMDINVISINIVPKIKTLLSDTQITLETSKTVNVQIDDRDLDELNLTMRSDSKIVSITPNFDNPIVDADYAVNSFSFELTALTEGNATITLTLDDGNSTTTQSFSVEVPTVVIENNQSNTENETNTTTDENTSSSDNNNSSSETSKNNTTSDENSVENNSSNSNENNQSSSTEENNNSNTNNQTVDDNTESKPNNENNESSEESIAQDIPQIAQFKEILQELAQNVDVSMEEDEKSIQAKVVVANQNIVIALNKTTGRANISVEDTLKGTMQNFTIKLEGSKPTVDEEGNFMIKLSLDNNSTIESTIKADGSLGHRVEFNNTTTKAEFTLDANTTIDENGTITTESQSTQEGFIYKAIVITQKDGVSKTKFIKINLETGEQIDLSHTLREDSFFEHGSTIEVLIINGKINIKTQTPLSGDLVIE